MTKRSNTFLGPHASRVPPDSNALGENRSVLEPDCPESTTPEFADLSPPIDEKNQYRTVLSVLTVPPRLPVNHKAVIRGGKSSLNPLRSAASSKCMSGNRQPATAEVSVLSQPNPFKEVLIHDQHA